MRFTLKMGTERAIALNGSVRLGLAGGAAAEGAHHRLGLEEVSEASHPAIVLAVRSAALFTGSSPR